MVYEELVVQSIVECAVCYEVHTLKLGHLNGAQRDTVPLVKGEFFRYIGECEWVRFRWHGLALSLHRRTIHSRGLARPYRRF